MELIELNAKTRETTGKGAARKMRANNAIPAIVYGAKVEPVMLSIDTTDFDRIIRDNGTTGLFFDLKIEGGNQKAVMLKALQMDTFGLNYVHVDLHEIDMNKTVTVSVPVETSGESVGVKEGGLLQIIRRELDVVCKPADTPDSIVIDVTELEIGSAVHVEDIDLGETIEIPHDVNFTVITLAAPIAEEVVDEDEDLIEEEAEAVPAEEATEE
ncbi:MAG: 50S ribosomal protein L25 [Desulfobacula sp.]|nr:50S ribosomal protein L25 [Desulfobacula sp.]